MKTPEQRVIEYIERTGNRNPESLRNCLKKQKDGPVPISVIREILSSGAGKPATDSLPPAKAAPEIAPSHKKITRAVFATQFDPKTRTREAIRAGLKRIGTEELVPDYIFRSEYCKEAATSHWRTVAGETEFFKNQVRADGKNYWAQKDTVEWALKNVQGAKEPR